MNGVSLGNSPITFLFIPYGYPSPLAPAPASVTINEPKCTAKTFPDYFEKLASISQG